MEVGIYHIEGRSSYFLPQKGTIIYFQWAKERECIDYNLNFLIDAFLTFLFMICFQKYISKVINFCLPVKIGSAILNDQVGSHMLNHLIFMFWCRSTRFCVPHCKEETWLNRLVWNLSRLIFSIKSSYLAEIGQLWHYFHESQQHFKDSRGCLSQEYYLLWELKRALYGIKVKIFCQTWLNILSKKENRRFVNTGSV